MSDEVNRYLMLEEKLTELRKRSDKAEGILENLTERLKKEYGISSVDKIDKALKDKERELASFQKQLAKRNSELEEIVNERLL